MKSQKSRLLFFRGCKTSCLYSFGTDIEPPQFWLCCRERVSVAAQLHPLVPRVAEALLLHLSVLPVSSVLHPCAPSGDTCPHGFISAPSLSSPPSGRAALSAGTCLGLKGCQARRCPCSPWVLLDAVAAPLLPWSGTGVAHLVASRSILVAGHLQDAAVGHRRRVSSLKVRQAKAEHSSL